MQFQNYQNSNHHITNMISNLLPSTIEAKDTNLLLSDRCNDLRYQIKALLHFLDILWLLHNKPWFRNLYWKSCIGIYLYEEICNVKFAEFIYSVYDIFLKV